MAMKSKCRHCTSVQLDVDISRPDRNRAPRVCHTISRETQNHESKDELSDSETENDGRKHLGCLREEWLTVGKARVQVRSHIQGKGCGSWCAREEKNTIWTKKYGIIDLCKRKEEKSTRRGKGKTGCEMRSPPILCADRVQTLDQTMGLWMVKRPRDPGMYPIGTTDRPPGSCCDAHL